MAMSNLDRDLAEMRQLGYGINYGKYKLDHPNTKSEALQKPSEDSTRKREPKQSGAEPHDLVCQCCGSAFTSDRSGRKYCSTACCRRAAKRLHVQRVRESAAPVIVHCIECGTEFEKTPNHLKYCSSECRKIATRKRQREWDANCRRRK